MNEETINSSPADEAEINGDTVEDTVSADEKNGTESEAASAKTDYARIVEEDIRTLREEFKELSDLNDISELDNPLRYAALRDLGLTAAEAYLATSKRTRSDNRSHLIGTRTVSVAKQNTMSDAEMSMAREIFSDISDKEIRRLYKRVTN